MKQRKYSPGVITAPFELTKAPVQNDDSRAGPSHVLLAADHVQEIPLQAEVADSVLSEIVPEGIINVPIEALYESPYQVRETGNDEEIDKLAESIRTSGLISPIVVRAGKRDKDLQCKSFEIITGHHRVLAAARLGWTELPVLVKSMSDAEAAIALTADNAVKKDLTDWDRYQSALMLERVGACRTGREIAATLGISTAQLSQLRAFGKLPGPAQTIIKQSPGCLGYRAAQELTQSVLAEAHPELVFFAIKKLAEGKIAAQNQLLPWIAAQLAADAPRRNRREAKIERAGKPPIKVVATDKAITISAAGLNPDRIAHLIAQHWDSLVDA